MNCDCLEGSHNACHGMIGFLEVSVPNLETIFTNSYNFEFAIFKYLR